VADASHLGDFVASIYTLLEVNETLIGMLGVAGRNVLLAFFANGIHRALCDGHDGTTGMMSSLSNCVDAQDVMAFSHYNE
jgi:hypothetical protein